MIRCAQERLLVAIPERKCGVAVAAIALAAIATRISNPRQAYERWRQPPEKLATASRIIRVPHQICRS